MRSKSGKYCGISVIINRILEGRISPINFLLILGFFSTLVLFYISLQVHFLSISQNIVESRKKLLMLKDENARLTTAYNEEVSPAKIIPAAELLGLQPGTREEMTRFAIYGGENNRSKKSVLSYASVSLTDSLVFGRLWEVK